MEVAQINVDGVYARVAYKKPVTKGMIGAKVRFLFTDNVWAGLEKTVVFSGVCSRDVVLEDGSAEIPAEVISSADVQLKVGVYGTDADKNLAIPTLWASLGLVKDGADPSGDPAVDQGLPIWATIQADVAKIKNNMYNPQGESSGGYYTPTVKQIDENTMQISFTGSQKNMPEVNDKMVTIPSGPKGKSAYDYAKAGGYTGTEEEFAEKLADETPAVDPNKVNALIDTKLHSVTSYGAVGDGATDDTGAFQTALAQNRVVAVPGGTYLLSDTLVIKENCCMELSQDTVLSFTQTSGNCIEMRGSATLRGNHGNIDVSSSFTGNVISIDTGLDGVVHASIPPYQKSTPMWKRQRFIYDVNITRTEGAFQGSLTGGHSGTALYISANFETTEEYDGSNTAPITYIWAMAVSGLRIGGAFNYGINIQNRDTTETGYGNSGDPAWNHDMRIEAVIVGCETGVRVFNCNTAHLDVTIQPGCSINKVNDAYVKYAKNGIILEHSNHIDLSQSIVWDWNSSNTLVDSDARNAHVALIGECKGVILSDFLYNASGTDIRDLIYTDTPGNYDSLVILQEPFTRWFKPIDNEPYFFDGNGDKRLALKEEIDEYFQTDRVAGFVNVMANAIDKDGSIYNGTGTASGYYNSDFTSLTGGSAGAYHIHTGFIPCKKGDTFITDGIGLRDDGCVRVAFFDSEFNYVLHANTGNMLGSHYFMNGVTTENGFRLTINDLNDASSNKISYARFNFNILDLGEKPVMSLNEEIKFMQEGFLADGIRVKGEKVILTSASGKAFILSVNDAGLITATEIAVQ